MKEVLVIAMALFFSIGGFAQKKTKKILAKNTNIILVVDNSGKNINEIELMIGETEKNLLRRLKKKYPDSKFYEATLDGSYTVNKENRVIPQRGTVVTMFTSKEMVLIPLQAEFSPRLSIGDKFGINKRETKVIDKQKGKLKFKYQ